MLSPSLEAIYIVSMMISGSWLRWSLLNIFNIMPAPDGQTTLDSLLIFDLMKLALSHSIQLEESPKLSYMLQLA